MNINIKRVQGLEFLIFINLKDKEHGRANAYNMGNSAVAADY